MACALLSSPSLWPVGCGKRAAFSTGCGRVPGGGWGRQPSRPRQTAGRGDRGSGGEGAFSTELATADQRVQRYLSTTIYPMPPPQPPPCSVPFVPVGAQGYVSVSLSARSSKLN